MIDIINRLKGDLSSLQGHIEKNKDTHVDWEVARNILCGVASLLSGMCVYISVDYVGKVLCGLASVISVLCNCGPAHKHADKEEKK